MARASIKANGNGGHLKVVEPKEDAADEAAYTSDDFKRFVERYRQSLSDAREAQAHIRELYKQETGKGLSKKAAQIALSYDTKIRNDKIDVNDAYGELEGAITLLDWMGYDEDRRGDLVARAEEEATASPPV